MPDMRVKIPNPDIKSARDILNSLKLLSPRLVVSQTDVYLDGFEEYGLAVKMRNQKVIEGIASTGNGSGHMPINQKTGEYLDMAEHVRPQESQELIVYRRNSGSSSGQQADIGILPYPHKERFSYFQDILASQVNTSISKTREIYELPVPHPQGAKDSGISVLVHLDTLQDEVLKREWPQVAEIEIKYTHDLYKARAEQIMQDVKGQLGWDKAEPTASSYLTKKRAMVRSHPLLKMPELDVVATDKLEMLNKRLEKNTRKVKFKAGDTVIFAEEHGGNYNIFAPAEGVLQVLNMHGVPLRNVDSSSPNPVVGQVAPLSSIATGTNPGRQGGGVKALTDTTCYVAPGNTFDLLQHDPGLRDALSLTLSGIAQQEKLRTSPIEQKVTLVDAEGRRAVIEQKVTFTDASGSHTMDEIFRRVARKTREAHSHKDASKIPVTEECNWISLALGV